MRTRAELGVHVGGGGVGFGAVPGAACAVVGDVVGVVAGGGVPADGEGLAGQAERDGAFDGFGGAVVGLADAEELFGVFDADLDGPATGVAGDGLGGGGVRVGGDQREVVAAAGLGLSQEGHGDRAWTEHGVPQAVDGGGVHGGGLAVAVHGGRGEGRGAGEVGPAWVASCLSSLTGRAGRWVAVVVRTGRRPCVAGWSSGLVRGVSSVPCRRRRRRRRRGYAAQAGLWPAR